MTNGGYERLSAESRLREAEARIRQAETFAWTVPGLAIAAEAFLLAVALNPGVKAWAQLAAALAGTAVLVAALHFLGKHRFNFVVYEAVIERSRDELDLPLVAMSELVGRYKDRRTDRAKDLRESFSAHTDLIRQGWLDPETSSWWRRWWRRLRNSFVRGIPSMGMWASVIIGLILLDVGVAVYAVVRIF